MKCWSDTNHGGLLTLRFTDYTHPRRKGLNILGIELFRRSPPDVNVPPPDALSCRNLTSNPLEPSMNYRQPLAAAFALYLICIAPQNAAAEEPSLAASQVTIEELRMRLNLTPQQHEQIAPLVEERKAKMEP